MPVPARYDDPALVEANESGQLTPDQQSKLTSAYRSALFGMFGRILLAGFIAFVLITIFPAIAALFGALFGLKATSLPIQLKSGASFSLPCSGTLILIVVIVIAALAARPILRALRSGYRDLTEAFGALSDISQRRIASEDGEIVWRAAAYHAQLSAYSAIGNARDLRAGRAATPAFPPPGAYRLFYLPTARILLSARPLAQSANATLDAIEIATAALASSNRPEGHTLQASLSQALGFSLDDLAANRSGTLSPAQVTKLRRRAAKETWIAFALGAAFAVGEIAYLRGISGPPDKVAALIALFIGGLLFLLILNSRSQLLQEVAERRVTASQGAVMPHLVSGDDDAATYYYILPAESLRLQVNPIAYNALVAGETYRMYYLARSKTILSIEPLPDPRAAPPQSSPW